MGWNLVRQLAARHDLVVLTHAVDLPVLRAAWARDGFGPYPFVGVALPAWLQPLRRIQGGLQLYCYLWQVQAWRTARRLVRARRFDLTHHLTYANDWMANFIGAWVDLPYLRGPGGGSHRVPAGMLTIFGLWGRIGEHLRSLWQRVFQWDPSFQRGQARARRLLLCNREAVQALRPAWSAKAELFPVNGVSQDDLAALMPRGGREAGPLRVVSAGKLIRLKGFLLALEAFRRLHAACPETEFEIIGDGPDWRPLERLVRASGLEGCVRVTPWQPRPAVLERLRRCDLFLFASVRDGGGAVVVEALAAGKPVVCLDVAGPGMHVTPACGMKIPARDPEQAASGLAEGMRRLCEDPGLRLAMGQAARTRAEQAYSWDRLGQRLADLYVETVGGLAPARMAACEVAHAA